MALDGEKTVKGAEPGAKTDLPQGAGRCMTFTVTG
jgi:hypothetical protein